MLTYKKYSKFGSTSAFYNSLNTSILPPHIYAYNFLTHRELARFFTFIYRFNYLHCPKAVWDRCVYARQLSSKLLFDGFGVSVPHAMGVAFYNNEISIRIQDGTR